MAVPSRFIARQHAVHVRATNLGAPRNGVVVHTAPGCDTCFEAGRVRVIIAEGQRDDRIGVIIVGRYADPR